MRSICLPRKRSYLSGSDGQIRTGRSLEAPAETGRGDRQKAFSASIRHRHEVQTLWRRHFCTIEHGGHQHVAGNSIGWIQDRFRWPFSSFFNIDGWTDRRESHRRGWIGGWQCPDQRCKCHTFGYLDLSSRPGLIFIWRDWQRPDQRCQFYTFGHTQHLCSRAGRLF